MFSTLDFDVLRRSFGYLFYEGMTFTLMLTALSALGGLVFGTLIALMRLSGYKLLGRIAGLYVDFMRSLPLVLVIFWFYFLVPYIGQWLTGASRPIARRRVLAPRSSPSSCSRRRISPRSCAPASSRSRRGSRPRQARSA